MNNVLNALRTSFSPLCHSKPNTNKFHLLLYLRLSLGQAWNKHLLSTSDGRGTLSSPWGTLGRSLLDLEIPLPSKAPSVGACSDSVSPWACPQQKLSKPVPIRCVLSVATIYGTTRTFPGTLMWVKDQIVFRRQLLNIYYVSGTVGNAKSSYLILIFTLMQVIALSLSNIWKIK